MASLRNVILVILVAVTLKNTLVWLSGQVGVQLQEYVVRDLRDRVYAHLLRLPLPWFTRNKVGQVISRILNDTSNAKAVVTELVTALHVVRRAGHRHASSACSSLSWKLSLAALVVAPLTIGALQPVLRKLRKGYRRLGNDQGEITSLVQEVVSGVRLIKSYRRRAARRAAVHDAQRRVRARLCPHRPRCRCSRGRSPRRWGRSPPWPSCGSARTSCWSERTLHDSELIIFLIWVMRLLQPLKQLSQVPPAAQQSLASAERHLRDSRRADRDGDRSRHASRRPRFATDVRFEGVTLRVRRRRRRCSDVSFVRAQGRGRRAGGRERRGQVHAGRPDPALHRADRADASRWTASTCREIRLDGLRALTGIVSQDTVLFNDTVRANVAFGRADATQAQLDAAARAANALAFIEALPEG